MTVTAATTATTTEEPSGGTGRRSADAARTTSGEAEATMIGDTTTGDTTIDVSCAHTLRKREPELCCRSLTRTPRKCRRF